ncbi:MAG: PA domain-containing protein [Saprospiraceae bacterium]|nr:PA domain-containing protein [Saprospiraceae bacterium]
MITFGLNAQFVIINSPEDCEGAIEFGQTASWGAFLTDSVWTGDLVLVDDGSAAPSEGCGPLVNGAEVAGNFALIDRGSCEFGQKALNAENVGATAVVIANHTPGAGVITLGAGAQGGNVTIPVIMITYEDGQMIKEKLAMGETVNMSMGDIRFDNDLSIGTSTVVFPPYSTAPLHQVEGSGNFVFTPGVNVLNKGLADASNVTLETTINYINGGAPTEVYNEAGVVTSLQTDSSELILLPEFEPANGEGRYEYTYSVGSDSTDDADFDNQITNALNVTTNVYSKARWDEVNNRPMRTNAYTIAGGGNIEMLTSFEFPNGNGYRVDSVQFYVSTSEPTLGGVDIVVYMYNWVDDGDGNYAAAEVELVALGIQSFDPAFPASEAWVTLPVEDLLTGEPGYVIPDDGARLVVGTRYEGLNLVFFGFDEGADLNQYINNVAIPNGTYNDAQLPYAQTTSFGPAGADFDAIGLFTDFWGSNATAIYVNQIETSTEELSDDEARINLYPNPATDVIALEVELTKLNNEMLSYEIVDMMGRQVFSREFDGVHQLTQKFDVSNLGSGTYELIVRADDGMKTKAFVVK